MPAGIRLSDLGVPPTSPIGRPDVLWGLPGQGGLLTEWAETVPDLTWPESVRTYGRMRRDARLSAILKAFFLPILRSTWAVDPEGVDRAAAVDLVAGDLGLPVMGQKAKKNIASPVPGFQWHDHVRLALLNLVYGHMVFEQWYDPNSPKDGLTHLAGVQERQPHTIAIIDIADDGQVREIEQNTQETPLPANRLLWYANEREGANWAGVSVLRSCYTPWILKHETARVHATSIRRFGMGVPSVAAPPGATPSQIQEAQRLASGMRVGDTAGAGLPNGFTFALTGLTGSVPDAVAFLNWCNQEMTTSALAGLVELGHSTYGSRAVGETFLDLFLLTIQAIADYVGDTATQGYPAMPGLARSLVTYNWDDDQVPRIVATDVGDRHEVTAMSLANLVKAGAISPDPDLEAFIRTAWGLPQRAEVNPPPPGAPQQGPGAPGPGQPGTPPAAPAPAPAGQPPGGAAVQSSRGHGHAHAQRRPDGLRRGLTPVEAASGIDPVGLRADIEQAAGRALNAIAPTVAVWRAELAEQVAGAIDDGRLDRLAGLTADPGNAADLIHAAMSELAQRSADRMTAEAASQGVTIDTAKVKIGDKRLRQVAQARAALAAAGIATAASRRALQVVQSTAGTDAGRQVTVSLEGLSPTPLADQLLAAMQAASNEGRFAVLDAGPDATYTATEILDDNTCENCAQIDGYEFAGLDEANADYPNGGYVDCLGELRCRGTVVATWPQPEEEASAEYDEADLYGDLGKYLGPDSWRDLGLARRPQPRNARGQFTTAGAQRRKEPRSQPEAG